MVEQVDREAAERSALALGGKYTCFDCVDSLAEALAAHRIAAEQRGREAERAAIVAWLEDIYCQRDVIDLRRLVQHIKADEHLGGEAAYCEGPDWTGEVVFFGPDNPTAIPVDPTYPE